MRLLLLLCSIHTLLCAESAPISTQELFSACHALEEHWVATYGANNPLQPLIDSYRHAIYCYQEVITPPKSNGAKKRRVSPHRRDQLYTNIADIHAQIGALLSQHQAPKGPADPNALSSTPEQPAAASTPTPSPSQPPSATTHEQLMGHLITTLQNIQIPKPYDTAPHRARVVEQITLFLMGFGILALFTKIAHSHFSGYTRQLYSATDSMLTDLAAMREQLTCATNHLKDGKGAAK